MPNLILGSVQRKKKEGYINITGAVDPGGHNLDLYFINEGFSVREKDPELEREVEELVDRHITKMKGEATLRSIRNYLQKKLPDLLKKEKFITKYSVKE